MPVGSGIIEDEVATTSDGDPDWLAGGHAAHAATEVEARVGHIKDFEEARKAPMFGVRRRLEPLRLPLGLLRNLI